MPSNSELLREAAMGKGRFLVRDLKISHKRCWIFKSAGFSRYGVWLSYPERKLYSFGLSYKSAVLIYYATRVWEHAVTETHWWLYAVETMARSCPLAIDRVIEWNTLKIMDNVISYLVPDVTQLYQQMADTA